MPEFSEEAKDRLMIVLNVVQKTIHWGFVPFVIYMGFHKGAEIGMPPLTIINLFAF
ncbi:mitochondrial import receptor subunit TOM7 homolog [Drosophila subobscura]|uniref:mitochondrial import receptor subunit TOM7 homolog n=1 Tax=Drosophila subobscura TaxID=7241 RepID=UPI00155ACFB2|nr:mitochondrial import receptor subunit TOM7 homolog [Drosophila subobscura]